MKITIDSDLKLTDEMFESLVYNPIPVHLSVYQLLFKGFFDAIKSIDNYPRVNQKTCERFCETISRWVEMGWWKRYYKEDAIRIERVESLKREMAFGFQFAWINSGLGLTEDVPDNVVSFKTCKIELKDPSPIVEQIGPMIINY